MIGNTQTIGTCSLCGGPVQLPAIWMAVVPPTPTCGRCGAVQKSSFGPVIEMEPPSPPVTAIAVTEFSLTTDRVSMDSTATVTGQLFVTGTRS